MDTIDGGEEVSEERLEGGAGRGSLLEVLGKGLRARCQYRLSTKESEGGEVNVPKQHQTHHLGFLLPYQSNTSKASLLGTPPPQDLKDQERRNRMRNKRRG